MLNPRIRRLLLPAQPHQTPVAAPWAWCHHTCTGQVGCRRVGIGTRARLGGRVPSACSSNRIIIALAAVPCHSSVTSMSRGGVARRNVPAPRSPLPRRPTGVWLPCRLVVTASRGSRRCWGVTRRARDGGVCWIGLLGCRVPRSSTAFCLPVTQDNPMPCCDTAWQHDGLLPTN